MAAFHETSKQIQTELGHLIGLASKILWFSSSLPDLIMTSSVIHKEPDHIDRNGNIEAAISPSSVRKLLTFR